MTPKRANQTDRHREGPTELKLDQLVTQHLDFIWRTLRRLGLSAADADDAAQTVFIVASEKIEHIRAGSERPYLYGIALRVLANTRRAARQRYEVRGSIEQPSSAHSPEDQVALSRAVALLDELLMALPSPLRRALVLAELEQCSAPEIAELEGVPLGTAASRLRRARSGLRELLHARGYTSPFAEDGP